MSDNETLDPSAPDVEIAGQPEGEAVNSADVTTTEVPSNTEQESSPLAATPPKLYAGKYRTVEELESAYHANASEATRMAQQLATQQKPQAAESKYSQEQLESWKEGRLLEVSNAQAQAHRAYAEGDYATAQQHEAQAREAARQIRLIDGELRKMDMQGVVHANSSRSAEQRLVGEATKVLQQYKSDLVPGAPLFTKASELLGQYQAMGMDPQNHLVQAQAVSLAAQMLGLSSKGIEQNTRKEMAQNINQALKSGVVQGGGKAAKSASANPDFMKMSDAEFVAYKAKRGWD